MHGLKTGLGFILAVGLLSGCLEPQPAPEIAKSNPSDFQLTKLQTGLDKPWSVAELPRGGFLITEIGGKIWYVKDGEKVGLNWGSPITGNPQSAPDDLFAVGQGGLLDVVLAPDFDLTGQVYISYAYGTAEANGTALVKASFKAKALTSPTVIFRSSPAKAAASHFAGKIVFLPDDTLVMSIGDGFAYREDAQKPDTHLGKLVRLTRDGGVPADNPYVGKDKDGREYKPQIYSTGHRNMQGLAIDTVTGELWEHEHGPRGGDELNKIEPGVNYGWPIATKGRDYQGARISPFETYDGMADPVHSWVPSIAPSGLIIYRGAMFDSWEGDALIGGLASRDLRRVDLENGKSVEEFSMLSELNGRVRDVRLARDGAILVLMESFDRDGDGKADPKSGELIRMAPNFLKPPK